MKKLISVSWVYGLVGIALCSVLFAFSPIGSHAVKVYLDDKLVLDQYIKHSADAPKLTLDPAEKHNQLIVQYSECGRTVTGRKLTLKDSQNKVLKDWSFPGSSTGFEESMTCSVKDIVALKQKEKNTLKLYYSSNEFPDGQQIAYLVIGNNVTAAR
jgi:hypothetical protein